MEPVAIVYHEGVAGYDFGWGHPFRGERFPRFMKLIEERGLLDDPKVSLHEPGPANNDDLLLVHAKGFPEEVERREALYIPLSGDTPLRSGIVHAARLIVGSSLMAGELVARGEAMVAESVGGGLHHAGRGYGGGFCVFNDVAVCAQSLIERHSLERVMILDSDVHAGNGTMDIFYGEPRVLFVSVHQDPRTIYPGTGFIHQVGEGPGEGYTVNVPLPPGSGDDCMALFLEEVFKPLVDEFKPEVIIRNGGSDPHYMDGLGSLNLTFRGLWSIGKAVAEASRGVGCGVVDLCCSGYNMETVAEGWLSLLSGVMERENPVSQLESPHIPAGALEATHEVIEAVKGRLDEYWSL